MQFLRRIYGSLLTLYPREYKDEFGEELQKVFNLSLNDAMKNGILETIVFVMRELIGLPGAILFEHLRERRKAKMKKGFYSYFDFANGSWNEFLTALFPFFLAGCVMPLLSYLGRVKVVSGAIGAVIVLPLLGILIILLVVGAKNGSSALVSALSWLLVVHSQPLHIFSYFWNADLFALSGSP